MEASFMNNPKDSKGQTILEGDTVRTIVEINIDDALIPEGTEFNNLLGETDTQVSVKWKEKTVWINGKNLLKLKNS